MPAGFMGGGGSSSSGRDTGKLDREIRGLERRLQRMGHPAEAERPEEKLTFLQRLGDVLSGPLYGVMGGLRSRTDPNSEQAQQGTVASILQGLKYTPYGLGLAGRPTLPRFSFQDTVPQDTNHPWLRRALAFGMDIAFDPLMYLTAGYGGAARAGQSALTRSGAAMRLAEPGARALAADALAAERAATMGRAATAQDAAEALAEIGRDRGGLKFMGQSLVPASAFERTGLPALKHALTTSPAARTAADIIGSGPGLAKPLSKAFFRETLEAAPGGKSRIALEPRLLTSKAQVGLSKIAAGFNVHPKVRQIHRRANAALTGDIGDIQHTLNFISKTVRTPEEHMVATAMMDAPQQVVQTVQAHPRFSHMSPQEIALIEQRVQPVVDLLRQIHDPANLLPVTIPGGKALRPFAGELEQAGVLKAAQGGYIAHRYFTGDPRTQEVIARFAREEVLQVAGDPHRLQRSFSTLLEAMGEGLSPSVNLLDLEAKRMLSGYRMLRMTQFLDEMGQMGPEVIRDIPKKPVMNPATGDVTVHMGIAPPGFVAVDNLGLPQLAQKFPGKALAVNEARYVVDQFKPWMQEEFLTVFDSATRWWKALATAVNPAFHTRNAIGNVWNMWLVGFKTPQSLADAFHVQRLVKPGAATAPQVAQKTIVTPQGPLTLDRVAELAGQQGMGASYAVGELRVASTAEGLIRDAMPGPQAIGQKWQEIHRRWPEKMEIYWRQMAEAKDPALAGLPTKQLLSLVKERATREAVHLERMKWLTIQHGLESKPAAWRDFARTFATTATAVRVGRNVGNIVEQNARLALFIDGLKQGLGAPEAAARVKQALFDYSDLGAWESSIRQIIPFWKWSRENVPLQIMALMKAPGKVALMFKLEAAVEGGAPDRERDAEMKPSWLKRVLSPKTPIGYAKFGLPSEDLGGSVSFAGALGGVNPLIKLPFELGMNRSIFLDQEIKKPGLPAELTARPTSPLMRVFSPPFANWADVQTPPYGGTTADPLATYGMQFVRPAQELMNLADPRRGSLGARAAHLIGPVRFTRADEDRERKNALYEKRRRLRDTYRGYLSEQRKTEAFRRGER